MIQIDEVLVACEGVPALVSFKLGNTQEPGKVLPLNGNVLDLAFIEVQESGSGSGSGGRTVAAVSIDHVHQPGSTQEVRTTLVSGGLKVIMRT